MTPSLQKCICNRIFFLHSIFWLAYRLWNLFWLLAYHLRKKRQYYLSDFIGNVRHTTSMSQQPHLSISVVNYQCWLPCNTPVTVLYYTCHCHYVSLCVTQCAVCSHALSHIVWCHVTEHQALSNTNSRFILSCVTVCQEVSSCSGVC